MDNDMQFEEIPLQQLTADDIHALVARGESERLTLEFHRQDILKEPKSKRRLAETVCAFANAEGGRLVIGIEDRNCIAVGAPGIDVAVYPKPAETAESIIEDLVQPGLVPPGRRIRNIPAGQDSAFVVVDVSPSENAPHMVGNPTKHFFVRRDFRSQGVDLRDAIGIALERGDALELAELEMSRALRERPQSIPEQGPWLSLAAKSVRPLASPLEPSSRDVVQWATSRIESVPARDSHRIKTTLDVDGQPAFAEHGLEFRWEPHHGTRSLLRFGRDGLIQWFRHAGWTPNQHGPVFIPTEVLPVQVVVFLQLVGETLAYTNCGGMVTFGFAVNEASGIRLGLRARLHQDAQFAEWNAPYPDPVLLIQDHTTSAQLQADPEPHAAKPNHRLWNAFGLERCVYFDETDHLNREET